MQVAREAVTQSVPEAEASASRVFVARQPILDAKQNIFGYELLFRSGHKNAFGNADGNQATATVMTASSLVLNMQDLCGGKPAFINITRDILLEDYIFMLPKELVAVELLETIEPDEEILGACQKLKDAGYMLVLDDFVYSDEYKPLADIADIVKVDFIATAAEERKRMRDRFPQRVRLLAEKVETHEEFQQGLSIGYTYFQGYFFSKPVIVSGRDLPGMKVNYLHMLKEIQSADTNFKRLESVVKRDVALTFKLLRYINSALFGLSSKVDSIMHAMTLLGLRDFKQWASLMIMAGMGSDKPDELVAQALLRGRFCEGLAVALGIKHLSQQLFLLGMFSTVDAILDRPMEEVLQQLPLTDEIKSALAGKPGRMRSALEYVLAHERGEWENMARISGAIGLDETCVPEMYQQAARWARLSIEDVRAL